MSISAVRGWVDASPSYASKMDKLLQIDKGWAIMSVRETELQETRATMVAVAIERSASRLSPLRMQDIQVQQ